MQNIILEQWIKERKAILDTLNQVNFDKSSKLGVDLLQLLDNNTKFIRSIQKNEQSLRNEKVLDKMFSDMGYNKKTHNVKYLKKNEKLDDLNVDIFLN